MLHQLPRLLDGEELKDELVGVGEEVVVLEELPRLPLGPTRCGCESGLLFRGNLYHRLFWCGFPVGRARNHQNY